jgi:hypothetical protein
MDSSFKYVIGGVPDYDQRRFALPNQGKYHCLPASAVDWLSHKHAAGYDTLFDHFEQDLADAGWSKYSRVTLRIWMLGAHMGTDANGTGLAEATAGTQAWLTLTGAQGLVAQGVAFESGGDFSFDAFADWLMFGARIVACYGRYKPQYIPPGAWQRHMGHCVAVVGLERDNDDHMLIRFRDPSTDETPDNLHSQSQFKTKQRTITYESGIYDGKYGSLLTLASDDDVRRAIDRCLLIQPGYLAFAYTTEPLIGIIKTTDSEGHRAISETTFRPAVNRTVRDLALCPGYPHAVYISEGDDGVWRINLVRGTSEQLASLHRPRAVAVGGYDRGVYVLSGDRTIVRLDRDNRVSGQVTLAERTEQIAFDLRQNRLLTATVTGTVTSFDERLDTSHNVEIPGHGATKLMPASRDGSIAFSRDGATFRYIGRGRSARVPITFTAQRVHAGVFGAWITEENGTLIERSTTGEIVTDSPLNGRQIAGPLAVPVSFCDQDPALDADPAMRSGYKRM